MSLIQDVRSEFPQLTRQVRGQPLVYLDSGATTLKPRVVIEAVTRSLSQGSANVHRGAHLLSDEATEHYESVREKVTEFLKAKDRSEIVFTRGTTEGLNLLASGLGRVSLLPGDEILLSQMEHHSNIVPWQMVALERGAKVRFVPVLDDGTLDQSAFQSMLNARTKVVSLVQLSNSLGTVNPLKAMFESARRVGAICVVDAAQSVSYAPIDVQDLGCDFLVFSGHKLFAPTGVGVLYGRREWLEKLPPYQGGGSMIREVREEGTDYLPPPHRFEAGTPAISDALGLGAALDFVKQIGFDSIRAHEATILKMAEEALAQIPEVRRIGQATERGHVLSFLLGRAHPSDVGSILDEQGVAVRAGHHCCQPLMRRFGIPGTVRASFSIYTNEADVVALARGVRKAQELLA